MILLRTKRLLIRHATIEDAPFILQLLNSNTWMEFIGDKNIKSVADAKRYIKKTLIDSYNRRGFGLYIMDTILDRKAIGICGFVQREFLDRPDLGFAILPEFERNGFTFEASNAVIKYGKKTLQLNSIAAVTTKHNTKSINLLKKLGFHITTSVEPKENEEPLIIFNLK